MRRVRTKLKGFLQVNFFTGFLNTIEVETNASFKKHFVRFYFVILNPDKVTPFERKFERKRQTVGRN